MRRLASLLASVLRTDSKGVPSNADKHNKLSVKLASGILERIGNRPSQRRLSGQMAGSKFEEVCKEYLEQTLPLLSHLRPGTWEFTKGIGGRAAIARYDQYAHLDALDKLAKQTPELAAAVGTDYLIKPDVVVVRLPEADESINLRRRIVDKALARRTPLRQVNSKLPILHASVSCKWTIRSDRSQNARSEALNLIRNRKGRLPHVVVVTGEPTPSRIASIALGTGDIDCVYHFALHELEDTVRDQGFSDAEEMLNTMTTGKRLRDISDLPFDLAI